MKKRGVLGALAGSLVLASTALLIAGKSSIAPAKETPWPTKGWATATPAGVGLDERVLAGLDKDFATGKFSLVDGFAVYRCGKKVFERTYQHDYAKIYGKQAKEKGPLNARLTGRYNYFDPEWHPYFHGTDLHSMQSVSKTVTSVILGIAVTRGDFKAGLNTPVLNYFDVAKVKNVDERKRHMTLKDVLTMTTGFEWNEDVPYDDPRNDASSMEAADDWVQYVIDKPMANDPGNGLQLQQWCHGIAGAHLQEGDRAGHRSVRREAPVCTAGHQAPLEAHVPRVSWTRRVACTLTARIWRRSATSTFTTVCGAAEDRVPAVGPAIADTVY